MALEQHGGNIYRFAEENNISIDDIIDFSASINPLGIPKNVIEEIEKNIKYLCHYPDPEAKKLRMAISNTLDIDPSSILCGNGSTELIYLIVRALGDGDVLIPAPTFSEYERACMVKGLNVHRFNSKDKFDIDTDEFIDAIQKGYRMAFLCNPNNPTGRLIKKQDLLKIAEVAKDLKCYLVVDEAFIDFVPEESVIKEVDQNPYLIVLRSMTKFYALSGIRVGYGVAHTGLIERVKEFKEPWIVNFIAQIAGVVALNDTGYKNQTYRIMESEKGFLEEGFKSLGITYFASSANFYLLRHSNAKKIISALKNRGIMVRDCSNFKGLDDSYMRIAVRSRKENMILLEELNKICLEF